MLSAHCYAESLTRRFASTWGVPNLPWTPANAKANVILHPDRLNQPIRWKRPRMIFVNSMSDLFHEEIPVSFVYKIFDVMGRCPQHIFQVLTKRPERMRQFCSDLTDQATPFYRPDWPLPNVWMGVSIENRRFVHRADVLRETPAAVRFISAEPLLGPLVPESHVGSIKVWDTLRGPPLDLTDIDWIIVGGESGPEHRRLDLQWVRDLRDATRCARCKGAGGRVQFSYEDEVLWCPECGLKGYRTACFVKQLGGLRPGTEPEDLPADLRIREFPEVPDPVPEEALF